MTIRDLKYVLENLPQDAEVWCINTDRNEHPAVTIKTNDLPARIVLDYRRPAPSKYGYSLVENLISTEKSFEELPEEEQRAARAAFAAERIQARGGIGK